MFGLEPSENVVENFYCSNLRNEPRVVGVSFVELLVSEFYSSFRYSIESPTLDSIRTGRSNLSRLFGNNVS